MVGLDTSFLHYVRPLLYWGGFLFYVYRVVWRNRKDKVLLCEAIGAGIFVGTVLIWYFLKLSDLFFELSAVVSLFFGAFALYFGLLNWAERRVNGDKAK